MKTLLTITVALFILAIGFAAVDDFTRASQATAQAQLDAREEARRAAAYAEYLETYEQWRLDTLRAMRARRLASMHEAPPMPAPMPAPVFCTTAPLGAGWTSTTCN